MPQPAKSSILQHATRFAGVGVVIAALYVAWTFYSRYESDARAAREMDAKRQAAREEQAKQIFGEGEIKIVSFSIDKPRVTKGESASLCYGVVNVSKVELDPPVEPVKPSAYHCLTVAPKNTTVFKLTASNTKGDSKSVSATLEVR